MNKIKEDSEREKRIEMEIVVDAYDEVERSLSWFYYLDENLQFPFMARCIAKRFVSPLQIKDNVEVLNMAKEAICEHDMFVVIRWGKEGLAVPLSQLQPFNVDDETEQAVEDWHYWIKQGHRF